MITSHDIASIKSTAERGRTPLQLVFNYGHGTRSADDLKQLKAVAHDIKASKPKCVSPNDI